MRLVAVTRVLNEDDIVEAFVRHHAPTLVHHIFLDNGSTDRTVEILRALKEEGLPITVFQNGSVCFFEEAHNTLLYRLAVQECAADWVLCLDCDEFIDARGHEGGLLACLRSMPADAVHGLVEMTNYHPAATDDTAELLVPRRITMRDRYPIGVFKCLVRGGPQSQAVTIEAGNHGILLDGQRPEGIHLRSLALAHYPMRSPARLLVKAVIGRLKVTAAGQAEVLRGTCSHYTSFMDKMLRDPFELLKNADFMENRNGGKDIVEDPILYCGTPLRYTMRDDDVARSIRVLAQYCMALAEHHGRMLDTHPTLRQDVSAWNCSLNRLL